MQAFDEKPAGAVPFFGELRAQAAAASQAQPRDAEADAEARGRLRVLCTAEGQELVERVLENTVLNILKEASFEEFAITQPPVNLVRLG